MLKGLRANCLLATVTSFCYKYFNVIVMRYTMTVIVRRALRNCLLVFRGNSFNCGMGVNRVYYLERV